MLCGPKKSKKKNQHEIVLPTVPLQTGAPAIDKLHQSLLTSRTGECPTFLSHDIRQFITLGHEQKVLTIISEPKRSVVTKGKIKIE